MTVTVTAKLEVEFVPGSGTYVDISTRLRSLTITRPRAGIGQAATVTTMTAVLGNAPDATGVCPFNPDNPAGVHYPNVDRDRLVRVTALSGASSWVRFWGWSDKWVPSMDGASSGQSTVTLTASCVLSRYARRRTLSMFGEAVGYYDANSLYYPFDESADADGVRVVSPTPVGANAGQVIAPSGYPGSARFSSPDSGHLTDGQIDFTRGDDLAPAPVVLIKLRDPAIELPEYYMGWYKISADPASAAGDTILSAYGTSGNLLWTFSVRVVGGNVTWVVANATGGDQSFVDTGAPRDEGWHYWALWMFSATQTGTYTRNKAGSGEFDAGSFPWTYDPRPVAYLVVGGQMPPLRPGKQTDTLQGGVSSLAIHYTLAADLADFGNPGKVITGDSYRTLLEDLAAPLDALVGGAFSGSSDLTPIMYTRGPGDLLARWNELAITTGGGLFTRPDGRRTYRAPADMRPITVALTLDASADLHMPAGGWQGVKDERPTRVTASGPVGSVAVIDTAAEALTGLRLEGGSPQTAAGTIGVARSAAARLMATRGSRLSSFGIDLTLIAADITAEVMALLPGERVRVTGLPTEYMGFTYVDAFASGWTETYSGKGRTAQFAFDTDPADDPADAILDNPEYGRVAIGDGAATITGGTCVGTTGTGTVIITSTAPLTTLTATGSTATNQATTPVTHIVALDGDATDIPPGCKVQLRNSGGTLKEATVFTTTAPQTSAFGFTNIPITPNAAVAPVAGDYLDELQYTVDLDWLGERITINVPGGSTSPQTCTVIARGVAPTVARVHAAGQAVEIWHAAHVAL